ncbi:putative sensor domain DACNV-containing protein [Pedobacter sp. SYSU D00535]|uniref:putative sensor domain DACNV-containing protein n=1 Tax=Pedobacter sp. SYSU D00535 TaxID=2810308 RepID=UPI001A95FC65|nr:hypothetical protein [Pedobacter sp. SYSU D00535]
MPVDPTYKAASIIAPEIEQHFLQYVAGAEEAGERDLAPVPSASVIETIIDVSFWTSLRREEGHSPRISLAYLPPDKAGKPLIFGEKLALTSGTLIKLAPGIERAGIHLGIWHEGDELLIWGTTRTIPSFCFVLEMVEPGLLVVKHRRFQGFGKYVNVAVLKGDQIKMVDEQSGSLPDCPALLTDLLGVTATSSWNDSVNILIQLATSMRAHGRGGTLLVVPSGSDSWKDSIIHPISYTVAPSFNALTDLMAEEEYEKKTAEWQASLNRIVDTVAGYTAIDGATIITDRHELLAFGAKIARAKGREPVEQIMLTEPVIGGEISIVHPAQNGGTRHLSAAQFVHDQRNAIALVASQDGKFTIFGWSPCEGMVHAHRIDALLL